jgi:hypothetical protein
MNSKSSKQQTAKNTFPVSAEIFQQVYDSPSSLPGKFKWLTTDADVRKIEKLLGMPEKTIGAPLWVSGDEQHCPKCKREINWLDIVSSAVANIHGTEMIARVILGDKKFVNTETPRAIENIHCFNCKTEIRNIRSFKCHNWAYAKPALLEVLQEMNKKAG